MRNALFFLVAALAGCGTAPAPPPIYLGHVATTTGPGRGVGEQEALGIRLAVAESAQLSQERLGGRPVHVRHADARGQTEAFESHAVRLVTMSRAVALYGGNSAEEVAGLDRGRVPLVTPLGFRPRGLSELVFSIGMTTAAQAQALARFALEEKGVKAMAVVVDERREEARALAEAFELAARKAFHDKLPKEDYQKVAVIPFGKDANFADMAKGVGDAKVQGVLFAGTAQDYAAWRQALEPSKLLILYGGVEGPLPDSAGVYLASAFAIDKELPRTGEFAQKFREAFKEEADAHAALAYEGVCILVDAMQRAQITGGERFLQELRQTKDFAGLTGPLTFGSDQQCRRPVFVGQMVGKSFTPLKRYEP